MRIGLQSWGTEGDLRPCLALAARPLAKRLRAALDDRALTERAAAMATALQGEDGGDRAAALVEGALEPHAM